MKERISAFILGIGIVLSLAACGAKTATAVSHGSDTTAAVSHGSETTAAAAASSVTSDAEPAAAQLKDKSLLIYCGAGMQKPFQKIADSFREQTGCTMNVTYANAAQIQTQIKESREGDFFIAGSADEVKPVSEYVKSSTDLVKHIPVLAVAKGNPKGITGIRDLGKSGITTVTGDPESTPIGKIAKKVFSDFGVTDTVKLAATTTTAPQLATVISMGEADAAIIWKENCSVDGVEICSTSDLDQYVKTVPAARLSFSADADAADAFSRFLLSDTAKKIWTSFGYELAQ